MGSSGSGRGRPRRAGRRCHELLPRIFTRRNVARRPCPYRFGRNRAFSAAHNPSKHRQTVDRLRPQSSTIGRARELWNLRMARRLQMQLWMGIERCRTDTRRYLAWMVRTQKCHPFLAPLPAWSFRRWMLRRRGNEQSMFKWIFELTIVQLILLLSPLVACVVFENPTR